MNTNRPPNAPAGVRAQGPRPSYPSSPPQYSQSQYPQAQYGQQQQQQSQQYSRPQYSQQQYPQSQQQYPQQPQYSKPPYSQSQQAPAQYSASAVQPLVPRPSGQPTRGQAMAAAANVDGIGNAMAVKNAGKEAKIGTLLINAQQRLQRAQGIVGGVNGVINSSSALKGLAEEIFAPAKAVLGVLEAVADMNPAIKIVAVIVRKTIEVQVKAKQNDEQVAVVYYTMSTMLILFSDLDAVFDQGEMQKQFRDLLTEVEGSVQAFGSFCEVYYRENRMKRYLKCGSYKEKLAEFVTNFDGHKRQLRHLLQAQGALKLIYIQTDVKKILTHIETKSAKEQQAQAFVSHYGGVDAVLKNEDALKDLAGRLSEKLDLSDLRRSMRVDLDRALSANLQAYELQIEQATAKITSSLDGHTRDIIMKLDQGPHEYIEDPDIRAVWKEMGSRLSAKTRIFLDAVNSFYTRMYARHQIEKGEPHADVWTLHFLSKIIFYPAISEGIDEDSSGFVSVHEVNSFLKSKPAGWSVAQWLAFWAAGPYRTDEEHQERIFSMIGDLSELVTEIENSQPQNVKRAKYFVAMTKKLRLICVYVDMIGWIDSGSEDEEAYASLEKLRIMWRNEQIKKMKENLEHVHYNFQGMETVTAVIGGRRLEQSIMCLIYLLLHRHMKIVRLAKEQTVAVAEFADMRNTWEALFDAFEGRMHNLLEIWRQQRLDINIQTQTFCRGLFEDWYKKSQEEPEDEYEGDNEYGEDDEYGYSDDDGDEDGDDDEVENAPEENANLDTNEGQQDDKHSDLASAFSNMRLKGEKADPQTFLNHEVPDEPEDEDGLTTDSEEGEWESPEVRQKKYNAAMSQRMTNMEEKLGNIETLLQQLLAQSGGAPSPAPSAPEQTTNAKSTLESSYSDNESEGQPNPHEYVSSPAPLVPTQQSPPPSSGYTPGNNDTPRRPGPPPAPPAPPQTQNQHMHDPNSYFPYPGDASPARGSDHDEDGFLPFPGDPGYGRNVGPPPPFNPPTSGHAPSGANRGGVPGWPGYPTSPGRGGMPGQNQPQGGGYPGYGQQGGYGYGYNPGY